MPSACDKIQIKEFHLLQIESSYLVVEILPEVGGKIAQIRNKVSGREYFVPPQRPYRTIPVEGDWLQHDTSGMDDCFPNVAAGQYPDAPWSSLHLPDLGEWTHGIWEVLNIDKREVAMKRSSTTLPYTATKTTRFLSERVLESIYLVHNHGEAPIRYLWSAHPLIAVEGEYEVILPGEPRLRTFPSDGGSYSWPMWKDTDLSRDFLPSGKTLKVFVSALSEGWCLLRQPSYSLRFTFDLNQLPALGIWFNNYGFPADSEKRFRCIALEPCTSPTDLLDELTPDAYQALPPGGYVHWSLQMEISPHDEEPSTKSPNAQQDKR
jgi:hypothetical protein